MIPPFPGMDPWLEHPAIWPDVHNSLIVAIADAMTPAVVPKYYIGLKSRTTWLAKDELGLIGILDISVLTRRPNGGPGALAPAGVGVVEVEVPMGEAFRESYLAVRDV